jgi:hypothetical protein
MVIGIQKSKQHFQLSVFFSQARHYIFKPIQALDSKIGNALCSSGSFLGGTLSYRSDTLFRSGHSGLLSYLSKKKQIGRYWTFPFDRGIKNFFKSGTVVHVPGHLYPY